MDDYWHLLLWPREDGETPLGLRDASVAFPANWPQRISRNINSKDHDRVTNGIKHTVPLDEVDWAKRTATNLNLESTLRPKERTKKSTWHF